ncbi:MAG: AAA family ATPase [Pirellulaceae bacterium]|nr:AAA family ATPase [Pirellulaceae bacterium]
MSEPTPSNPTGSDQTDQNLDQLLERINALTSGKSPSPNPQSLDALPPIPVMPSDSQQSQSAGAAQSETPSMKDVQAYVVESQGFASTEPQHSEIMNDQFVPRSPTSFNDAKISPAMAEELILKFLLSRGEASGRQISQQIRLPFILVSGFLNTLKHEQLITYAGPATMNDYICRLTENGGNRAHTYSKICTYFGSTPVVLKDYVRSVKAQTIEGQYPTRDQLRHAFSDLLINEKMLDRLGPAISSGRGMFLHGYPGNGKTSIAERITKSFGPYIWIPRALYIDGEIMRLYDPTVHEELPLESNSSVVDTKEIDHRWVRIKRPTIVVGGELNMEHLEITFNQSCGVSEAPVQLKSNCGILVIDDFGRQKMRVEELLNRWIVPLEKRYDYLNLSSGKKVQLPFDQLVVFSTNLEPRDLVDDAFMRRIPYKIEVENPTFEMFHQLFQIMARNLDIPFEQEIFDYMVETYYRPVNREFRNCHPRDLLLQILNYCRFNQIPTAMTKDSIDFAIDSYFSVM